MRIRRTFLRCATGCIAVVLLCYQIPASGSWAAQSAVRGPSKAAAALLAQAVDLGAVQPSTPLTLILDLTNPRIAQESADVASIYTPGAKQFGEFLTPSQVEARYGPAPAAVARLKSLLAALGLSANWQSGNDWIIVNGNARHVEAAFGIAVHWYRSASGSLYYASNDNPVLPASLRPYVSAAGLVASNLEPIAHDVPSGGLAPADLLQAYDLTPLRAMGLDGAGQTIVFFEIDGYIQTDFNEFTMFNALPLLQPKLKAGPMLKPDGEAEMDMEVVHEIAPKAKILVYDFNWDAAVKHNDSMQTIWSQWLALETRIVKENPGAIVSESIGGCEGEVGVALAYAYKQLYDEADALGESVFVSSGDDAAYDCLQDADRGTAPSSDFLTVDFPASVPSLTAVGGTRLSVATDKSWLNETVWEDPAETVGSGGGISAFFSRPSWQKGPGVQDPRLNPANMRSVPDVSADADPDSGVAVYGVEGSSSKPAWSQGGGTSQAAPIWAGMTALIDEYLKHQGLSHPVGFMNPALYTIASDRAHYPLPSFHDVTMGNNLYYSATPGYDMASGLGTPDAYNLARSLATYERGGG